MLELVVDTVVGDARLAVIMLVWALAEPHPVSDRQGDFVEASVLEVEQDSMAVVLAVSGVAVGRPLLVGVVDLEASA